MNLRAANNALAESGDYDGMKGETSNVVMTQQQLEQFLKLVPGNMNTQLLTMKMNMKHCSQV